MARSVAAPVRRLYHEAAMNLYLIRHGDAADGPVDAKRPLTPLGREQARRLADFLHRHDLRVRAVWHSGLVRALQTANVIQSAVRSDDGLVARPDLGPMDKTAPVAKAIAKSDADLMIVGHEPFLGKLAARLVTGRAKRPILSLEKGAMVCLGRESDDHWTILWSVTPALLPVADAGPAGRTR